MGMEGFLHPQVTGVLKLLMKSIHNGVLQLCNTRPQILV